jgi:hypothetical protein
VKLPQRQSLNSQVARLKIPIDTQPQGWKNRKCSFRRSGSIPTTQYVLRNLAKADPANSLSRSLTQTREILPLRNLYSVAPIGCLSAPLTTSPLGRHWKRAFRYARREDWVYGAGMAAVAPAFMLTTERFAPSFSGRGAFPPIFRLSCAMGLIAGVYLVWERSCRRSHTFPFAALELPVPPRQKKGGVWKGDI